MTKVIDKNREQNIVDSQIRRLVVLARRKKTFKYLGKTFAIVQVHKPDYNTYGDKAEPYMVCEYINGNGFARAEFTYEAMKRVIWSSIKD